MSELSKQALKVDNNTSFPNNNTNYITPSILRAFNTNVIDSFVTEGTYQPFTQSVNASISSLSAQTASYVTSAITASSLITASFSGNTLTFTKGNGTTFGVVIPDVSGSNIPAGTISGSGQIVELGFLQTSSFNSYTSSTNSSITQLNASSASQQISINALNAETSSYVTSAITASSLITASFSGNTLTFTKGDSSTFGVVIPDVSGSTIDTGSFATTGSNTFTGKQIIDGYQNGIALTGSQSYIDLAGPNSHLSLYQGTGSIRFYTGSANGTGTSDIGNWVNMQVNPGNGALAISAFPINNHFVDFDVATTSSIFTAPLKLSDTTTYASQTTILNKSGSLVFIANGLNQTVSHITSTTNQTNFIFKANDSTGETLISGSNNIFGNQNTPTTGFRKYVTNANLGLSGNALPQFSSSMAFSPTVSSNIFAAQASTPMTVRGPVSSSAYTIQNNALIGGTVNLGTAATTNFEKASNGFNMAGNIINGTVQVTAYKTNFISSSAMAISANTIGGAVTLNADSSSIALANNTIQNGGFVVNNSYYNVSATGGGNSLQIVNGSGIFGTATTIFASGSNTTAGTGRQFQSNLLAGTFNSASVNLNGDNSNMFATAIIGHGLNVTGSAALQTAAPARSNTYGSAFFGRNNAQDGNKARTAETVFAIGTGTTTTPKTGFLIDSGSNTFIEGTLNVSGSTTITGSLILSSSNAIELQVIGNTELTGSLTTFGDVTLTNATAKLELTGAGSQIKANNLTGSWGQTNGTAALQINGGLSANGNIQFNVGAFQSGVIQSGSANVSQSMNFETTDISQGVTIASNSQITLANSGTYNIQFSAQLLADGGADDVYIWLKKNGTNVSASAGHVILANNEELIAAWNYVVSAAASDYFEIVWQSTNGDAVLLTEAATGNIPSVPSIILTVTQVR